MESMVVVVFGICLILAAIWYAPLPQPIKNIALCVLCLLFGLWLLGGASWPRWR